MDQSINIISKLSKQGYRLTPQRMMILSAIEGSDDHISAEEIYTQISAKYPNINISTVYRTLEILGKLGLICEVYTGGNTRSYLMRRPSYHHHHLVCSGCGTVVDFADCDLSELADRLSQETGFAIESHLLEFTGRCMDCQSRLNK